MICLSAIFQAVLYSTLFILPIYSPDLVADPTKNSETSIIVNEGNQDPENPVYMLHTEHLVQGAEAVPTDIKIPDTFRLLELYNKGENLLAETRIDLRMKVEKEEPSLDDMDKEALVEEYLHKAISGNRLYEEVPGLGRVEINGFESNFDGLRFAVIRVVLESDEGEDNEKSYIFSDKEHFLSQNLHFRKKYFARQFHIAQRDVVHLEKDAHGKIRKLAEYTIPDTIFAMQYWTSLWHTYWQATTSSDKKVGVICSAAELALIFLSFELYPLLSGTMERFPYEVYAVKIGFSAALGVFLTRMLQNWVELSPRKTSEGRRKVINVLKRSSVSFAYGLSIMAASQGFAAMDPTTSSGVLNWSATLLNLLISNAIKDEASELVNIRSRLRLHESGSKKVLELQVLRTLTGYIRYADLILTGTVISVGAYLASEISHLPESVVESGAYVLSRSIYLSLALVPMFINNMYLRSLKAKAIADLKREPTQSNRKWLDMVDKEVTQSDGRMSKIVQMGTGSLRAIARGLKWWIVGPERSIGANGDRQRLDNSGNEFCQGIFYK